MKFQATLRTFIIRDIVKIQVALANIEIRNSVPLSWVNEPVETLQMWSFLSLAETPLMHAW